MKPVAFTTIIKRLGKTVWFAVPGLYLIYSILGIFHGSSHALGTYAFQKFFDSVTDLLQGQGTLKILYLSLIFSGAVFLAREVLNGIHNFMASVLMQKLSGKLNWQIHEKARKIDPLLFEDSDFLDDINKAKEGAQQSLYMILIGSTLLMFYVPYFLFLTIYLYSLKPVLMFTLLFVFIPVATTQYIRGVVFARLEDEVAPLRREFDYYERTLVHRDYFKETRTLGAFSYLRNLYLEALKAMQKKQWSAELKTGLLELGMQLITFAGYGGVLYLLVHTLLQGEITVGSFAAILASLGAMFNIMEEIVVRHFGAISKGMGTVHNFISFLDLTERSGKESNLDPSNGVRIKNASFTYPGALKPSLKNINLEINKGETLAIVGHNGAGKTTLVRLLTGLYLPTTGVVFIDGVNSREIAPTALFRGVSAVFQKFQRYQMTLEENVAISDLISNSAPLKVHEALDKAQLKLTALTFPDGLNTMLSREFEGVDLSGGQWQRVAIARGFYRDHDLIILDEPTAAIDPLEETRIYRQFEEISQKKTAILVTHRLGSARVADRIVVLDQGEIVAIGTHNELIKTKGKYQEMYKAQATWYVS